jgi:hypothetical protein
MTNSASPDWHARAFAGSRAPKADPRHAVSAAASPISFVLITAISLSRHPYRGVAGMAAMAGMAGMAGMTVKPLQRLMEFEPD